MTYLLKTSDMWIKIINSSDNCRVNPGHLGKIRGIWVFRDIPKVPNAPRHLVISGVIIIIRVISTWCRVRRTNKFTSEEKYEALSYFERISDGIWNRYWQEITSTPLVNLRMTYFVRRRVFCKLYCIILLICELR